MKIRPVSEIQRNKNKTFSINLNCLINLVANITDKKPIYYFSPLYTRLSPALPPGITQMIEKIN